MSRQLDNVVEAAYARFNEGDLGTAEAACAEVLRKSPRDARALHLLGVIRLRGGDARSAVAALERAVRLRPADDRLHEDLGLAQLALGECGAAERTFVRALKLARAPRASLHARLGDALTALERHEEAQRAMRAALEIEPRNADLLMHMGNALAGRRLWDAARACFEQAAAAAPERPDPLFNAALIFERAGRYEDAARGYADLLLRFPAYHDAYINLGIVHEHLGRNDEALRCYRRALEIEPGSSHAYANLGKALRTAGRLDEAQAACLEALRIVPASVDAIVNLAGVLTEQGRAQEALVEYEKALALDPAAADARFSYAALNLALGHYGQGWRNYGARPTRLRAREAGVALDESLPQALEGRHVLVRGEQGLGDELFFLRHAAILASRGACVHVECDARLATLIGRTAAFASVSAPGALLSRIDHTVAAGDLPLLLCESGYSDIPPPFALTAIESRVSRLRDSLRALGPPPYIGLTWAAGTSPELQRGRVDRALFKSVPLDALARALAPAPGTLIALQRQPGAGAVGHLASLLARAVHDYAHANDDLEEMLALLCVIDEYVGVSNTNMHLRAGLGRSARVLVPNPPEWRWMWRGVSSPWFPRIHVYRETAGEGWEPAIDRLARDMSTLAPGE